MSAFYEEYKGKRREPPKPEAQPKERSLGGVVLKFVCKILAICLCLALVICSVLWALPASFFAVEPNDMELSLQDGLPLERMNVLFLGVDASNQYGTQRSDSMIVASVGYDGMRLASIMRDSYVEIPGKGKNKINAAYALGGAELAMRTVNENFDMNIMRYVAVDFVQLAKIVDALGGVTMDVSEKEMENVNIIIDYSSELFSRAGIQRTLLEKYGENTLLNGLQAVSFARIRKIDSDYQRTNRQRKLLRAMVAQAKSHPVNALKAAKMALTEIDTNLSPAEIVSLGLKVLIGGEIRQTRLPVDGTFVDDGSKLNVNDVQANASALYEFIYGD